MNFLENLRFSRFEKYRIHGIADNLNTVDTP